jgi:putative heme-binding domain-containing protein
MTRYAFTTLAACGVLTGTLLAQNNPGRYTQARELAPAVTADSVGQATAPAIGDKLAKGPQPQWVWGPDPNGSYTLSRKFTYQPGDQVLLKATCDNVMTLKVNGRQVAQSSEWQSPVEKDLTRLLQPGENELTADVENQGGIAGFIAKLAIERGSGETEYLISQPDWTAVDRRTGRSVALRGLGGLGVGPWNNVFENSAGDSDVPGDTFVVLPGFQVEKLFTVPKEELGSWVCITTDPRGRIIASDQGDKGLCRITPAPVGSDGETIVERLPLKITAAQGLLFAFDALYISVNGGPGSGLYRAKYNATDDTFGEVEKLHEFRGGGEHGPHALRLSPDGTRLYVICGNHTRPPFEPEMIAPPQTMGGAREQLLTAKLPAGMASRILPNWDEDLLLKRQWDANGHARGILAPGGWIASTDPDGKTWEIFSVGYRNPYDMAFNADGELFAYDADMEWDMGSPWYRPTRVVHATSGSEFGWRSGTGKWPTYYLDSLPPMIDIGPGSPVGVEFGYGTRFPARYQRALYILDWTFGTMYAIHITPAGSTYTATKEEFVSRNALPLTDATVGADGALYFTIGGRGTQSELYRVTYSGTESTEPANLHDAEGAADRQFRRELEQYHHEFTLEATYSDDIIELGKRLQRGAVSPDRFIRYAARVAGERILSALREMNIDLGNTSELPPDALNLMATAVARAGVVPVKNEVFAKLRDVRWAQLTEAQQLDYLRALSLMFIRFGTPEEKWRAAFVEKLDPLYPAQSIPLNMELVQVLVFLQSPTVIDKTIALLQQPSGVTESDLGALLARNKGYGGAIRAMLANQPDKPRVHYAFALKDATVGWTPASRKAYFQFLDQAKQWSGGNSYRKFIQNIDDEAFLNASELERLAIEATGARKPFRLPELPVPQGPGKDWTLAEVRELAATGLQRGRDFKNGEKMYAATRCILCHRFGGDGGATGPDLTQLAGRFNLEALTEAILEPSKVISDQYRAHQIALKNGQVYTGRIVSETTNQLTVVIDPEDSTKVVDLPRDEIEELQPSSLSLMPVGLLKPLNENEVLDLLAYLLSRGNPNDRMFRK